MAETNPYAAPGSVAQPDRVQPAHIKRERWTLICMVLGNSSYLLGMLLAGISNALPGFGMMISTAIGVISACIAFAFLFIGPFIGDRIYTKDGNTNSNSRT